MSGHLGPPAPVVGVEGIEVATRSFAPVSDVSVLVDMEAVSARAQT